MEHGLTGLLVNLQIITLSTKAEGPIPSPSCPFCSFCHPSSTSSEAPLPQGEETQPTLLAHMSQYVLPCYNMRVRDDLRQIAGAGKGCSSGFITYIHFNTSVSGETSKHLLLCSSQPTLTYCPLTCFTLNRHYCPKEHNLKLVQFGGEGNKSGFF